MGVLSVIAAGLQDNAAEFDDQWHTSYETAYRVTCSSYLDDPPVVAAAVDPVTGVGIPGIWTPYVSVESSDPFALVRRIRCKREQGSANPWKWLVSVFYDSRTQEQSQTAQDPLDDPPEVVIGFERVEKALEKDLDGNAIANSAEDPYDPPRTKDDYLMVVTVVENKDSYDSAQARDFLDTYNADTFWGFAAEKVLCTDRSSRRAYRSGVTYWVVTTQMKVLKGVLGDGVNWRSLVLLDQGFRSKGPADISGSRVFSDKHGQPLSKPTLLDGAGEALATGGTPHYRTFNVRGPKNFDELGLPSID